MRNYAKAAPIDPMCTETSPCLRIKLPHANTVVANSTSHGTNSVNTADGVLSNSNPPTTPPRMLTTNSTQKGSFPAPVTNVRPAKPEVTCPGNKATVEVMFAAKGDIPDRISTGRVTKEPPPAREFCKPAQTPATRTSSISIRSIKD